mmetsp:Transcript_28530/g.38054  ORF Transcript_28530/g.38054 Transcript_28530/m.38054 type:complete len:247 (+) Transcript_28530:2823-3563(+)
MTIPSSWSISFLAADSSFSFSVSSSCISVLSSSKPWFSSSMSSISSSNWAILSTSSSFSSSRLAISWTISSTMFSYSTISSSFSSISARSCSLRSTSSRRKFISSSCFSRPAIVASFPVSFFIWFSSLRFSSSKPNVSAVMALRSFSFCSLISSRLRSFKGSSSSTLPCSMIFSISSCFSSLSAAFSSSKISCSSTRLCCSSSNLVAATFSASRAFLAASWASSRLFSKVFLVSSNLAATSSSMRW